MYYRITMIHFDPERRSGFLKTANGLRDQMHRLVGLEEVHVVEVAPGQANILARYADQSSAEAAELTAHELLGQLAEFFVSPPERLYGEVTWSH